MRDGLTLWDYGRHYLIKSPSLKLKYWWHERLPWWVAWKLPHKVALFCFVRVYGVIGRCGEDYAEVYHTWERRGH